MGTVIEDIIFREIEMGLSALQPESCDRTYLQSEPWLYSWKEGRKDMALKFVGVLTMLGAVCLAAVEMDCEKWMELFVGVMACVFILIISESRGKNR